MRVEHQMRCDGQMRWGVLLPTFDALGSGSMPVAAAAGRAEELGFDSLWVGDHLLCPAPVLDALCCLSAAAAVTGRVGLGLSVLQLGLRHLVWTAKQLATIDVLAPGRLRIGVGVGGEFPEEFVAAGADRQTRGRRLDEMLEVLPDLLEGRAVDHFGSQVRVSLPGLRPALASMPALSVGGRGDPALLRAARYGDQWMAMWYEPEALRTRAETLAEMAASLGRPAPSVAMLVIVNLADDPAMARQEVAAYLMGQYRLPLEVVDRWTLYGPPEQAAKLLVDYREAGVSELVLLPAAADVLAQYERFAELRSLVEA